MTDKDYVLGTDDAELNRLRRQHELWKEELLKIWRLAGFHSGQKILDLGCGPGFTTRDLGRWLGPASEITAVDASERFLNFLNAQQREVAQSTVRTVNAFVEKLDLPKKDFDGAFCRWLMIFVPKPEEAIQNIHRHLRPGARFAIQEYCAWDTIALCPDRDSMGTVVRAVFKSWRDEGGDPNRGRLLPSLLEKNKFRVLSIEPVSRAFRPNEPLWEWTETFLTIFIPVLVEKKYLQQADADRFFADLADAKKTPGHYMLGPTLVNIIAERL